jgi:homoserine dehydrogenase
MKTYRLDLIGFGNVGQGLAQILANHGAALAERYGAEFKIVAVSDFALGSLYNSEGLDPALLLQAVANDGHLRGFDAPQKGWDALETIGLSNADVLVEMSYTDLETGEPAAGHIREALAARKHVSTTNKGPIALHYPELAALARKQGVQIAAEGTVMSGTPALALGLEQLAGAGIWKIQGILNGTTNYILSQLESGASYAEALRDAQDRGYAEADPTGDVEGIDAAGKVVILANLLMDKPLTMADVKRRGITGITAEDIAAAQSAGERWKLIGTIERRDGQVEASVQPVSLPLAHPLAGVSGATNAITYSTELLGDVTLVGPGAGRMETGYAIISDLLAIHRATRQG